MELRHLDRPDLTFFVSVGLLSSCEINKHLHACKWFKINFFAGEKITAVLTNAPGNGAAIGGLKVTAENGWFAARPSGTEDVYKIYAESFKGRDHLEKIKGEAQEIVNSAFAAADAL